jgi:hypothetical protein
MADRHELLVQDEQADEAEFEAIERRASPFPALYAHWARKQWSALALDLETDRTSFVALSEEARTGMVWIFAHRFHAEFNVARLLAPFLLAAPSYDVQRGLAGALNSHRRHAFGNTTHSRRIHWIGTHRAQRAGNPALRSRVTTR